MTMSATLTERRYALMFRLVTSLFFLWAIGVNLNDILVSIIGGAVIPAVMGRVSNAMSIHIAFAIPLTCHLYILYSGLRGYKSTPASAAEAF